MTIERVSLVWPKDLPVPQRSGYTYQPTDTRAKSEMEAGGRYRVLYDTDETIVNAVLLLKYSDLPFFEAFERHMLAQGSVWFKMPLLTAGVLQEHIVRFRDRPKFSGFLGGAANNPRGFCSVTLTLDLRERATWSSAAVWLVYNGINAKRLHDVMHTHARLATQMDADVWLCLKLRHRMDGIINTLHQVIQSLPGQAMGLANVFASQTN